MKKYILTITAMAMSVMMMAVPARRGFHEYQQADGSKIELQLMGDEFYHYLINRDGKQVREVNGMYEVVGEAPTAEVAKARRAKAVARRQRKVGVAPNLAPKGIVILVNFKDSKMQSAHTQEVFDELCNSEDCTVNKYNGTKYPSAGEYFKSQSNGLYHPQFDVFGPVTLSRNVSYYGTDKEEEGDDQHATDAVVEACILANQQFTINWADYDSDKDGYVDFVYVIYAGRGQAEGAPSTTIWPHNWEVSSAMGYGNCTYSDAERTIKGKKIENYAMSAELSGSELGGIGTLCHEFGHVMGLPDFYDTEYGTNYDNELTPNEWDIMDGGSYNGDGHCPPNYDPWEKYFFGWITPVNYGNEGQLLEFKANGSADYNVVQVNASGTLQGATTSGWCYYVENRQQTGWDKFLPAHGLVIWKVNYNESAWEDNTPNNTANNPKFTIVCSSGKKIGADYGENNVWPNGSKTTWSDVSGKPIKNIKETNGVITAIYIEEPVVPVDPFDLTWMVNGQEFAKTTSTGKIVLPAAEPEAIAGMVFVGWCKQANYASESVAPEFVKAGQAATEGDIFYAVFAKAEGEGGEPTTATYTFTSKDWKDATSSWTSDKDGMQYNNSNKGVQITASFAGAGATMNVSLTGVTKVVVTYCTNGSSGAGSITVTVGDTEKTLNVTKSGGTTMRDLTYEFDQASGTLSFTVDCTTNSIYVQSITITAGGGTTYSGYTTTPSDVPAAIDNTMNQPAAVKAIRDGQVVIIRGDKTYSILGVQQ